MSLSSGAAPAKRALRSELKSRIAGLDAASCAEAGRACAVALSACPPFAAAASVCAFLSLPGEVDSRPLLEAVLAAGKRLSLPRVAGEDLEFAPCFSADGPWTAGAFGIREPAGPAENPASLPGPLLVLAPGLGFDLSGGRLGRGKGFYDRFLSRLRASRGPDVFVLGVLSEEQLVEKVPRDAFDLSVDALLLPGRFVAC